MLELTQRVEEIHIPISSNSGIDFMKSSRTLAFQDQSALIIAATKYILEIINYINRSLALKNPLYSIHLVSNMY